MSGRGKAWPGGLGGAEQDGFLGLIRGRGDRHRDYLRHVAAGEGHLFQVDEPHRRVRVVGCVPLGAGGFFFGSQPDRDRLQGVSLSFRALRARASDAR